ncbi:MAG TPA: EboA domain-containing protein [Flavitalea sp.]|nr:EboA domain-containing protein [Flavitalea sp.]
MYSYHLQNLKSALASVICAHTTPAAYDWLNEKIESVQNASQLNATFVVLPRKTGKSPVRLNKEQSETISKIRPNLIIKDWAVDRVARVWLLLHTDATDTEKYFRTIENLFPAAEVNELIALYSSLPILAYQEKWTARCSEGIRNNIADVLKAIMCNNPYPSENLNEAAWNQMVLKAFFTEKPIQEIIGLDERANEKLATTLSDYAHERWAAHREVNPLLWRCVGPFIDEQMLPDIEKLFTSHNEVERKAAALAAYNSNFSAARKLLSEKDTAEIRDGKLSWEILAQNNNDYVLQQ